MYSLRNRPLDPGAGRVLCLELVRRLTLARRLQRLVLLARPDHERARARRLDAALPYRADAAIGVSEADVDDVVTGAIPGWFPDRAHVPARARRPLCLPVDDEIRRAEAVIGTGLPTHVTQDGADQVNLGAVAVDEVVRGHIARIDDVLPR